MTVKPALIFIGSILLLADSNTVQAQVGNCFDDGGNLCLSQCGVFTQTEFDRAIPNNTSGPYTATAIYPDCTATCSASGIGINYAQYNPNDPCYNYELNVKTVGDLEVFRLVAPGAPVLGTSCAGTLIQLNLPTKQKALDTVAVRRQHISFP